MQPQPQYSGLIDVLHQCDVVILQHSPSPLPLSLVLAPSRLGIRRGGRSRLPRPLPLSLATPTPQELGQEHGGEAEGDEADGVAGGGAAVQDGEEKSHQLTVVLWGTVILGLQYNHKREV